MDPGERTVIVAVGDAERRLSDADVLVTSQLSRLELPVGALFRPRQDADVAGLQPGSGGA